MLNVFNSKRKNLYLYESFKKIKIKKWNLTFSVFFFWERALKPNYNGLLSKISPTQKQGHKYETPCKDLTHHNK